MSRGNIYYLDRFFRPMQAVFTAGYKLARQAGELVCPTSCAVCRVEIEGGEVLCNDCWQMLREDLQAPGCPVCGQNVGTYALIEGRCHRCQNRRPTVSQIVRVGDYRGALRQLILAFKFHRESFLDRFLGDMLAATIMGQQQLADVDLLVPVPLHWRRRLSRRYNQSELLAEATARNLARTGGVVSVSNDLLRIRHTQPQSSLPPSERLINLTGAFAVRRGVDFSGKHLCLIDDVSTTGTTLRVAAQTLKRAGARKVSAAVLAVAAND